MMNIYFLSTELLTNMILKDYFIVGSFLEMIYILCIGLEHSWFKVFKDMWYEGIPRHKFRFLLPYIGDRISM